MLAKDSVASRMASDSGMSFTEFTYQILQGYDFMHLHKSHGVTVQVGGTDQYGNITAGIELIKRDHATAAATAISSRRPDSPPLPEPQVFGLTLPLLTTSDGRKFGKSMGNAPIWLTSPQELPSGVQSDSEVTQATSSPYQLYQYFLATPNSDLIRYFKLFTDYTLSEIEQLEKDYLLADNPRPQQLARLLAEAITHIVHGEAGVASAQQSSSTLFGSLTGGEGEDVFSGRSLIEVLASLSGVPQLHLPRADLVDRSLVDLFVLLSLTKTKAEARRLIANGGAYINGKRIENEAQRVRKEDLRIAERACLLRCGKKKQAVVIMEEQPSR